MAGEVAQAEDGEEGEGAEDKEGGRGKDEGEENAAEDSDGCKLRGVFFENSAGLAVCEFVVGGLPVFKGRAEVLKAEVEGLLDFAFLDEAEKLGREGAVGFCQGGGGLFFCLGLRA